MTVHDALDHPWLREDHPERNSRIPSNRFDDIRQRIRNRYVPSPDPTIGLGRMADWSSLRKNKPQDYKIYNSFWGKTSPSVLCILVFVVLHLVDRREAAPRFILRPRNAHVLEGNNADFDCRIIAVSPPVVSWYKAYVYLPGEFPFLFLGIVIMSKFVSRQNISRNMIEIIINWKLNVAHRMIKANTLFEHRIVMVKKNMLSS